MKNKLKSILLLMLIVPCLFLFVACGKDNGNQNNNNNQTNNEEDSNVKSYSEGLAYVLSSDETYYIVTGIGSCEDSKVVIPSTYKSKPVKEIKAKAFFECDYLTSVTIPTGVIKIGDYAFKDCISLTNVYYTGTIENWCNITFSGDDSNPMYYASQFYIKNSNGEYEELTEIEIPSNITKINNHAFDGFSKVTKVTIPNSVTGIGGSAFSDCSSLTSIIIPDSVTSIGDDAFSGCSSLTNITILDSVTSIGNWSFSHCRSLTSIIIPDSVTSIGESAFKGCSRLQELTLPFVGESETKNAFLGYIFGASSYLGNSNYVPESLKKVTITKAISIGNSAFYNCSSLTNIIIQNSVTNIGYYAFKDCSSLTSVCYTGAIENWCNITFSDSNSNPMYYASQFYIKNSNGEYAKLTEVEIPNTVTKINDYAFFGLKNVTKVTIPNSVTSIGSFAFEFCSSLASITIPNSVKNIGDYAFCGCSSLTSVTVGHGVMSIGNYAFSGCSSLKNITIPDSVTSIGEYIFGGYSSLKEITLPFVGESETKNTFLGYIFGASNYSENSNYVPFSLKKVTITKSIGDYAFKDCSNLTNITIQNSVTNIGDFAFSGCNSLQYNIYDNAKYLGNNENPYLVLVEAINKDITTCTINNNTQIIYSYAFWGCGLTSITIPSCVTNILSYAFIFCDNLKSVIFEDTKYWRMHGDVIQPSELSNASNAAELLKRGSMIYWYKG